MSNKTCIIYKIYYGSALVYVGRTTQKLQDRLRGHFFKKPMHKVIDIHQVTKVEYATLNSVADMYLYEIYYINKLKPSLNKDDKAKDTLSISLPELDFQEYQIRLIDKWKSDLDYKTHAERIKWVSRSINKERYTQDRIVARKTLSHEEYEKWLNDNEHRLKKFDLITEDEFLDWCTTHKLPF